MQDTLAPVDRGVVFLANEGYSMGLAAALASLMGSTGEEPSRVVLIDLGLSSESKRRLEEICPAAEWVDGQERLGELPRPAACDFVPAMLAKLFLPTLLPADLDTVLYIDCDVLIRTSIVPLLQLQLNGRLVAAVRDFGWPCGHRELTAAGWNLSDPYFNSGVLLINLKALQARSIVVEKLLAEHGSALIYQDQDVFNLLASMGGGWLELPLEWNVQGLGSYASACTSGHAGRPALFSEMELQRLSASPAIVHFTGPRVVTPSAFLNPFVPFGSKPWAFLCPHPWRDAFFDALDATPWAGWRPSQDDVSSACADETLLLLDKVAEDKPDFDKERSLADIIERLQDALSRVRAR